MGRDHERRKQFGRRALVLGGGQALLFAIVAGRLYDLQVIEAERYRTLAEDNRISLRLIPPRRGRILDRLGRPLAANRQDYRLFVVAERVRDIDLALAALEALVDVSDGDRKRVLRDAAHRRPFMPVTVREHLRWDEVARIEVNTIELPGVGIEEGYSREYPYGSVLAPVLGYVAPVSEAGKRG